MEAHRLNQELIALQHELVAALGLPPSRSPPRPTTRSARRSTTASAASSARPSRSTARPSATARSRTCSRRIIAEFCPPGAEGAATPAAGQGGLPRRRGAGRPRDDPRRQPAPTAAARATSGRSTARSASCRARTARRSSSAARRRPSSPPCSAPAADEQRVDGLMDEYSKKFMLDYNFPSFAVGEVRPIRGPGRREIGHGALAERSRRAGPARPGGVPLHDPRRLATSSNRTARARWPRSAAARSA